MLITLSRRTAICQSVAEVYLTGVAPLGAVSHRFNFNYVSEGQMTKMKGEGGKIHLLDDLRNRRRYWELKEESKDKKKLENTAYDMNIMKKFKFQ